MAQAENSLLGIAKQVDEATQNVTNSAFKYVLFRRGALGVDNIFLPLGPEVGGGALERAIIKAGAAARGNVEVTPRPNSLGDFLYGATGDVTSVADGAGYHHTFKLGTDQFDAPWYTFRTAPGALQGEIFYSGRVVNASLNWQSPGYINGVYGMLAHAIADPIADPLTTWTPGTYVDSGPQFITPISAMELPTGGTASVLSGSFLIQSQIPLDQQYVVGNYFPQGLDIVHRMFQLNLMLKIVDTTVYNKIFYDDAAGGSWTADIFREADINIQFVSDVEYDTGKPYKLVVTANGQTGASANVLWSARLLDIIAQRVLVMNVTGTFIADPLAGDPILLDLYNSQASY